MKPGDLVSVAKKWNPYYRKIGLIIGRNTDRAASTDRWILLIDGAVAEVEVGSVGRPRKEIDETW